jgi:arabinofuranan 3-O-arabinosyltransferase
VDLAAGENTVAATSSPAFTLGSIVLGEDGVDAASPSGAAISSREAARLVVDPGPDAEVLDVHQNVNPGWAATQAGATLAPVTIDGWQQGWVLDSDDPVVATFAPDLAYRAGLVVGAGGFGALLAVVLLTRRRWRGPDQPPLPSRRISLLVLALVFGVGIGLVAGWAGVVVAAVVAPLTMLVQRRWADVAPWALAAPCVVAGAAYAVRPWGDPDGWAGNDAWPHYLVLVSVAAALSSVSWRLPTRRAFRRRAGRSTSR